MSPSWKKSLAALWAVQFLAMVGMSQFLPFLPLYVQSLGVKEEARAASWGGFLVGISFLCSGLMAPVWGNLADRWGRRRMVLRAMAGSGAALCLMAFARNVYDLLFLRIAQGVLGGFISATIALALTLVPETHFGYTTGSIQAAVTAGIIVGPVIGGVLADALGFRPLLLFSSALVGMGVLVVFLFVPEDEASTKGSGSPGLWENIRFVLGNKALLVTSAVQFLVQCAMMSVHPVLALVVKSYGTPPGQLGRATGIVFGATAIAMFFGAFFMGRQSDRWGHKRVLSVALLGAALATIPQAFVSGFWSLTLFRVFLGVFSGGVQPASTSFVASSAPLDRRAGVLGVTFAGAFFGSALGPMAGGSLAAWAGVRAPFWLAAFLLFLSWVLVRTCISEPRSS
ncbi:MAG: MFS transporter [Elusimicrobia bacterium]|nr:MFS transporter [Elusimicrobiota bacterium]